MKICWHKTISESDSPEARSIRLQYPMVNYDFCKRHCHGNKTEECRDYKVREMNEIEEETANDSSLVNLLNTNGGLDFPI